GADGELQRRRRGVPLRPDGRQPPAGRARAAAHRPAHGHRDRIAPVAATAAGCRRNVREPAGRSGDTLGLAAGLLPVHPAARGSGGRDGGGVGGARSGQSGIRAAAEGLAPWPPSPPLPTSISIRWPLAFPTAPSSRWRPTTTAAAPWLQCGG